MRYFPLFLYSFFFRADASNVHIIKDGTLYTAPTDNLILAGIARAHLIKACKKLGIPVSETPFTLDDLMNADEIITTSSTNPCIRAGKVDGKEAGMKREDLFMALHKEIIGEFLSDTAE